MKPKVAVLMGGRSLERDVSLKSGQRVCEALVQKGYPYTALDVDEQLVEKLLEEKPDVAYIALHGKFGEDGTVQGLLEVLNIPYTGPDVYSCQVSFDKILAKEILFQHNVPTPTWFTLSSVLFKEMGAASALGLIIAKLGLPLVVKPAGQGSALGIKVVHQAEELPKALISALSYDEKILIEKYINGVELAVSIIGQNPPQALPIVEVLTKKEFFDFESRYTMGATDYFVPARLSKKATEKVNTTALKVYQLLKCRDVARVDLILSEGNPYVLELNTSPGMTETSLLPLAAKEAGLELPDLVEKLVQMALARQASK